MALRLGLGVLGCLSISLIVWPAVESGQWVQVPATPRVGEEDLDRSQVYQLPLHPSSSSLCLLGLPIRGQHPTSTQPCFLNRAFCSTWNYLPALVMCREAHSPISEMHFENQCEAAKRSRFKFHRGQCTKDQQIASW